MVIIGNPSTNFTSDTANKYSISTYNDLLNFIGFRGGVERGVDPLVYIVRILRPLAHKVEIINSNIVSLPGTRNNKEGEAHVWARC